MALDDAICLCCLTHGSCHDVTGLRSLLATAMGLPVDGFEDGFHLFMPSPHDLQHALDQFVCIML